ncbi:MAG: hypothetical protein ACKOCK_00865, partial [Chloroflexota bacterium]
MLLSDKLIFVHVMKTAGTSMTTALLRALPGDVHAIGKVGMGVMPEHTAGRVIQLPGDHHISLANARPALWYRYGGVPLDDMPPIVATIRNPYDRAHSWFAWAQQSGENTPDRAMTLDGFSAFILKKGTRRTGISTSNSFLINGEVPPNLRLLRFEQLAEDYAALADDLGLLSSTLPRYNRSAHGDYRYELTPEAEEVIFQNEEWLFRQGFYEREVVPTRHATVAIPASPSAAGVTVDGPAELLSSIEGLLSDRWVGTSLRFALRATAPTQELEIRLAVPPHLPANTPAILLVDDIPHGRLLSPGEFVRWRVPMVLPANGRATITVTSAGAIRPADHGGSDIRNLRFHLSGILAVADHWPTLLGSGLARKGPAKGLYQDGWLAPMAQVGLRTTWPAGGIEAVFYVSEAQPLPMTLAMRIGDMDTVTTVETPGLASLTIQRPTLVAEDIVVELFSYPSWEPDSPNDHRP